MELLENRRTAGRWPMILLVGGPATLRQDLAEEIADRYNFSCFKNPDEFPDQQCIVWGIETPDQVSRFRTEGAQVACLIPEQEDLSSLEDRLGSCSVSVPIHQDRDRLRRKLETALAGCC